MRFSRVFRQVALTGAIALAAPLTWLADPARACTCADSYGVFDAAGELRGGRALAVVTQTNDKGEGLVLRVDRSAGPTHRYYDKPLTKPAAALPATLTGKAAASGCGYVPFQAVKAVAPYPRDLARPHKGGWSAAGCRDVELGDALQQIAGDPPATSTAEPVAVLAGNFGNSSLASVDRRGEVVAWNRQRGVIENLTACPGGDVVVTWESRYDDRHLSVRDARTLEQIRTLSLPANTDTIHGLRCEDTDGARAQVLVAAENPSDSSMLFAVTDTSTAAVPVAAHVTAPLPDGDGFIGTSDHEPTRLSLVRIAPDGQVHTLRTDIPKLERLTISPDRRTAAAIAGSDWPGGKAGSVVSFETSSGDVVASWAPPSAADTLAWTGAGQLLVRVGHVNAEAPYRAGTLEVRDRDLKPLGTRASAPGSLTVIGDSAVGYGHTRLSLASAVGEPRVVDNLWLAGATIVVSLLDAGPTRDDGPSSDEQLPWVLGGLGFVVVGLAAATMRWQRT